MATRWVFLRGEIDFDPVLQYDRTVILHAISGSAIMPTTLRASYSFSPLILKKFNALVPNGERSKLMEQFMQSTVAQREKELENIAEIYMTDPAFAQCREDEQLWDVTVADGLGDA